MSWSGCTPRIKARARTRKATIPATVVVSISCHLARPSSAHLRAPVGVQRGMDGLDDPSRSPLGLAGFAGGSASALCAPTAAPRRDRPVWPRRSLVGALRVLRNQRRDVWLDPWIELGQGGLKVVLEGGVTGHVGAIQPQEVAHRDIDHRRLGDDADERLVDRVVFTPGNVEPGPCHPFQIGLVEILHQRVEALADQLPDGRRVRVGTCRGCLGEPQPLAVDRALEEAVPARALATRLREVAR